MSLIPARIIGSLTKETIDIALWPGRMEFRGPGGYGTEATIVVDIAEVPASLRAPNTDVWIVSKGELQDGTYERKIVARSEDVPPEEYNDW